ncbi:hypothetical protein OAS30_00610 [Candidatus Pelagibacter sp.]|nr:hypothetical protein [Candidatus Pelagibacter sp.]
MGIEDIQISEELETNAPSIKYSGNEGPKSPQEMEQMIMASLEEEYLKYVDDMMEQGIEPMTLEQFLDQAMAEGQMSGGQPLPNDPTKPVNPFQPKPTGPALPDRQMAAYGGIMGLDGRKKYGIGSWFQENIMDPIKGSTLGKAATAAAATYLGNKYLPEKYGGGKLDDFFEVIGDTVSTGKEKITDILGTKVNKNDPESQTYGGTILSSIGKNIVPIVGGIGAGLFTKNTESDTPGLPDDTTGINLADYKKAANLLNQKQGLAAGMNFLPTVASRKYSPEEMAITYANAANGGRIGYQDAGPVVDEQTTQMILDMNNRGMDVETISTITQQNTNTVNAILSAQNQKAEGGIMDLGGMEKDYRAEGGFVPIGKQEKADDVPARLSVNEFVFTADAVRNAGGGDIDQGAQVMENMMKHLEAGGQVSEESQGMAGARDMFATSQRLGDVI